MQPFGISIMAAAASPCKWLKKACSIRFWLSNAARKSKRCAFAVLLRELVAAKKEYDHVAQALKSVRETGYGLVPPQLDELTLQEPEIIGKGGKFGVRLRASAPSLHLIRVDIQTEVSPVVGTEQQSEEMLRYFMEGFEQDPQKLWQSNLFGKPLSDLVREGLSNKLMHMPEDTQLKVQQTLEKIINEGNGGMVCILL
ncbi:MAG: stage IV sporulation protein A [Christensenellales bacterium]